MEYEIDTELRQQTEPVRTCQNVNATDLEPAVAWSGRKACNQRPEV